MVKSCVICKENFEAKKRSNVSCSSKCQNVRRTILAKNRYATNFDRIKEYQRSYNDKKKLKARLRRNSSLELQNFTFSCSECGKSFESSRYNAKTCSHFCKKTRNLRLLQEKRKNNSLLDLKIRIRTLIATVFYKQGYSKKSKCEDIIGLSFVNLRLHLKRTYERNYNEKLHDFKNVHIDHIIPISSAKSEDELLKLNFYTNLQLLKSNDNRRKSNKLDFEIF